MVGLFSTSQARYSECCATVHRRCQRCSGLGAVGRVSSLPRVIYTRRALTPPSPLAAARLPLSVRLFCWQGGSIVVGHTLWEQSSRSHWSRHARNEGTRERGTVFCARPPAARGIMNRRRPLLTSHRTPQCPSEAKELGLPRRQKYKSVAQRRTLKAQRVAHIYLFMLLLLCNPSARSVEWLSCQWRFFPCSHALQALNVRQRLL